MPIIDDLELPIKKNKIDGPAVRFLATRKEDNNCEPATVKKFRERYDNVKENIIAGLTSISSKRF